MVTEVHDFLTKEECQHFIKFIDAQHHRSSVSGGDNQHSTISEVRTSSTSNLPIEDELVQKLKKKIAAYIGIDIERGEDLQGQLYEPGQFFKAHTDFFEGSDYFNHCMSSGNRTHTFMIYLNEDMEGGETAFPNLDMKIKPTIGKGVFWEDMIDGELQYPTLHEGTEVKSGKKYIITSWWRENKWNPGEDARLSKERKDQIERDRAKALEMPKPTTFTFSRKEELPKLTETGFKVVKTPEHVWGYIQDAYNLLRLNPAEENFPGREDFISGKTELYSFDAFVSMRSLIHRELQPIHEEWSNRKLTPTSLYGIRSYPKDATLKSHTDTLATHHVSSIIIVDKDLACGCNKTKGVENDWPLDIQDHNGEWHKVYAEIGDMILYESAICLHGREEPFKGNYFRNFYVHYKLNDAIFAAS